MPHNPKGPVATLVDRITALEQELAETKLAAAQMAFQSGVLIGGAEQLLSRVLQETTTMSTALEADILQWLAQENPHAR